MIVTGGGLRLAIENTLKSHLPDALTVIGNAEGITLPPPQSWSRLADFTADYVDKAIPAIVTTVFGVEPNPQRQADQSYEAWWRANIYAVCWGNDFEETADRVAGTVAAIRATLSTYPSLGGFADSAEWLEERYDEFNQDTDRTIGGGSVTFRFLVSTDGSVPPLITPLLVQTTRVNLTATVTTQ